LDFLKKYRFDIIIACSAVAFLCDVYFKTHSFRLPILGLYILSYAFGRNTNDAYERKAFLPKGLTKEDIKNIAFVKDWEEVRKKGIVRYALVYGGIFFGFGLCAIFSVAIWMFVKGTFKYISDDPAHMVNFIGYTYVAGVISGTILYRFIWVYNEQKFIRLTDPLH